MIGDPQLQAWAQPVVGAQQLISSVTDSYARSTAVPGSDMDFLLLAQLK